MLSEGAQRSSKGLPEAHAPPDPPNLQDHDSRGPLGGIPGELPRASWGAQATRDLPKVVGQASPGATEGPLGGLQGLWRGSQGGLPGGGLNPHPPKSKALGGTAR